MKIFTITAGLTTLAALSGPAYASASSGSCADGLTTKPVQFESALTYDDMGSKSNPAVQVRINGKLVKMQLDSGSNIHNLWDKSLIDDSSTLDSIKLDAVSGATEARVVKATLADKHGRSSRQEFALLADSALAQDGFSGILSPQAVAGLDAAVIDFDRNCFFTSSPFDVSSHKHLHVARGTTIRNSHDGIAVSVDLDGQIIPLETDEEGVPNFGHIGMDILKDRVVYYDGTKRKFNLLTRLKFDKSLGQMH